MEFNWWNPTFKAVAANNSCVHIDDFVGIEKEMKTCNIGWDVIFEYVLNWVA